MSNTLVDIINSDISAYNAKRIEQFLSLTPYEFEFFHIREITFEEEAPKREALENVLGSLRLDGVNFVYLIVGDKEGISFYMGVAKNKNELELDIDDIANQILKSNIEANFRGSKLNRLSKNKKKRVRDKIEDFKYVAQLNGVPNVNEEAENFQGIDRLVDVMLQDEFALMITAQAISLDKVKNIEKELFKIYDKISPFVKKTIQKVTSKSKTNSEVNSKISSNSISNSNTQSFSDSETKTVSKSTLTSSTKTSGSSSFSKSESGQESTSNQTSSTISKTTSTSKNESESTSSTNSLNYSDSSNESEILNVEFEKKEFEEWLKYIDEVLLKRINYAKGKGAFLSGVYMFANTKGKIKKLGNSFISLFSGVNENKLPLEYSYVKDKKHKEAIYNFQLPKYSFDLNENQKQKMILFSQINGLEWFSTKELSIIASLPQKEVVGLRLKEEVEFGLNVPKEEGIKIGHLIRSGQKLDIEVALNKNELNKHIFITGVTGSGKTTTCHKILYESDIPFLVIEPAKTEYRNLLSIDDVLVFTFGNEKVAPFRLNPFELFENENISSRVDMIKAAIESSFDMEAAIPQIIESAIYRTYEKKGWDIGLNINFKYENPFDKKVNAFPMLEDVLKEVEEVVKEQNFDERLHKDYIGSIKARLQSLIVGSKKFMLNTPHSFDFKELIHKKVVIELEEIKNPSEKSFIMGLILINLNEAIKDAYKKNKDFKHITLVEEAHRLLSRFEPGDSLNKKNAIESFTDMLAEVRKYGESLIIIDQIPNKLTPEVLKNTNTKIVHRIFAKDDKEAIGNTMALSDEQKDFLSKLDVGKAVIFNQNFFNAVQVQVNPISHELKDVDEKMLRKKWLEYIKKSYNFNISLDEMDKLIKIEMLWDGFIEEGAKRKKTLAYKKYYNEIAKLIEGLDIRIVEKMLKDKFYNEDTPIIEVLECLEKKEKLGLKMRILIQRR